MPKEICPIKGTEVSARETSKGDFTTAEVSKSYSCQMRQFQKSPQSSPSLYISVFSSVAEFVRRWQLCVCFPSGFLFCFVE
ncbi:hypothetical protein QYF36_022470 [Acer negundo]|nr:hypothetical protein QYF36_022470 [Acer negundo]